MSKAPRRFRDISNRTVPAYLKPGHDVNKAFFEIAATEQGQVIEAYLQSTVESFAPNPLDDRAWAMHEAARRIAAEILILMRKDPHAEDRSGDDGD